MRRSLLATFVGGLARLKNTAKILNCETRGQFPGLFNRSPLRSTGLFATRKHRHAHTVHIHTYKPLKHQFRN